MTYFRENVDLLYDTLGAAAYEVPHGGSGTLALDARVTVLPNPTNEHDSLAVGVYWRNHQIGWVARTDHWYIHGMLDMKVKPPERDGVDRRWLTTTTLEGRATVWYHKKVKGAISGSLDTASLNPLFEWTHPKSFS
jgi:hypothetical protein